MEYFISYFSSQKITGFLFGSCMLFSSCLKNKDSTGDGPKSQVAITNYIVNGSFNVLLDNALLTIAPLSFGSSVATGMGGYAPIGSGLHNLKFTSGSNIIIDNTISLKSGINYSLFVYDTLQNNKVKTLLLTDDLTAIDTVARVRFLQFIPGVDSLTISFKKDVVEDSTSDIYIGNKKSKVTAVAFSLALPPGNYQIILKRKGVTIFQQAAFNVIAGKLYTLISRGIISGTGDYKENVSVVQQN
jgi:hypothetical protein